MHAELLDEHRTCNLVYEEKGEKGWNDWTVEVHDDGTITLVEQVGFYPDGSGECECLYCEDHNVVVHYGGIV